MPLNAPIKALGNASRNFVFGQIEHGGKALGTDEATAASQLEIAGKTVTVTTRKAAETSTHGDAQLSTVSERGAHTKDRKQLTHVVKATHPTYKLSKGGP